MRPSSSLRRWAVVGVTPIWSVIFRRVADRGQHGVLVQSWGVRPARYPTDDIRLQFRGDFVNAFNQVQWLADPTATQLDNTCTISITACAVATDTFGHVLATRAPREIQLGLKLYW